jgi:hypothetical protein
MRFLMLMIPKGYETAAPDLMPTAKEVEAMTKYNKSLKDAGVLISLEGLTPPSMGSRVRFTSGKPRVIRGPFSGLSESLGGYWMIRVKSREEATEWALKCPAGDGDIIEIRQIQEAEDFPPDVRAAEKGFIEEMERERKM